MKYRKAAVIYITIGILSLHDFNGAIFAETLNESQNTDDQEISETNDTVTSHEATEIQEDEKEEKPDGPDEKTENEGNEQEENISQNNETSLESIDTERTNNGGTESNEENTNNETNNEESNEANFDEKTDEGTKEDTDDEDQDDTEDEISEGTETIQNIDDNNDEGENKDEDKNEDESEDENLDQDGEENFEDTPVLLRSVTLSTPSLRSMSPLGNTLQNANNFSDFEEIVYTGILDDAEVSYTIMDRNLGATSNNVNDSSSDGYYYQYGNNHGFERADYINSAGTFKALGPFTTSILSGVTKPYYSEIFSKIKGDRSVESPLALRGGEDDGPENDYDSANPRIERQGPCPTGRHVPSMEEMYLLLRLFFSNNGIEFQKKGKAISYPERVGKEGAAEITLTQGQYDFFLSTFKIRLAGRIDHNADNRYIGTTRPQSFWWVSTKGDTMNSWNLQTHNNQARGIYLNLGGWADYHTWALPMRCLKDETDLKVIRRNDDGTILETDEHLDFGIMPEYNGSTPTKAPDENYIYEFSGWNYPIGKLKRNRVFTATFSKQERSGYIVTFSGTDLAPVTVIEEQKVAKPDNPTRDDAIFLGWYADPEFNQIFDFSSPIMQDTIIYAKWQEDENSYAVIKARSFPITYHFGDSLTFNKDKLINTDLHLFTTGNLLQDFVISMGIDQFSFKGVAEQATVFSLMDERGEPYPGILTRKQNERSKLEFVVNTATQNKVGFYTFQTGFISFARFNQSIYSGDESNSKVVTGIAGTPSFDYPLVIGGSLDENKDPWRLMKGALSNVNVKVRYDSAKPFQFPEPSQSGWDFIGRYKDTNFTTPATTTNINSGDILYPKWEPITYVQYTFNAGSGVFSDGTEEKSDSYKVRNSFPTIEEPILSGYHFIGRSENKINLSHENTVTPGDKTFYALYEPEGITYTVEHYQESLNGTFTLKDTETKSGTTDTFTNATAKSYPGFSLSGEIEQKRIAGDESTIVQIYYKRNEYTITFNTNGGSPINPITAKYGSLLTSPNAPTKYGYIFEGWTPAFPSEMPLNGDTLQAQRTPKTIHVTLDHQGGTGGTSDFYFSFNTQKYYLDENLTQEFSRIIKPTRTGYEFQDYFSEQIQERFVSYQKNGERIELDTPIEDTYYKIGEDMTLKARRKAKEYTIKFVNTEDGNFFINNYQYDQTFSIPENPFIKTGYTFLGRETQDNILILPQDVMKNLAQGGEIILTAKRVPNQYQIYFSAGGGEGTMNSQIFTYGEMQKLQENGFTKPGYTFKNRISENGAIFSDQAQIYNILSSGSILFTAQWKKEDTGNSFKEWRSGGGGSSVMLKKDNCPHGDFSDSYYDRTCEKTKKEEKSEQTHGTPERTKEDIDIFQRALKKGLTSTTTLESFRGNEGLKRSEMAKVISIFTMQFMDKKKSPNNKCQNFNDIKEITSDLHDYIILACELGIMGRTADGQGVNKDFWPNDEVTKAEAVTIISRTFWGNLYKNQKGQKRYENHLQHLLDIGVLDNGKNMQAPFLRKQFFQSLKKLYTLDL